MIDVDINCDPVGFGEIHRRLKVDETTPRTWWARGELPEPRGRISRNYWWDWRRDIEPWALKTGRAIEMQEIDPACPACGTTNLRLIVPRHGGYIPTQDRMWWSCGECGRSEWEGA